MLTHTPTSQINPNNIIGINSKSRIIEFRNINIDINNLFLSTN